MKLKHLQIILLILSFVCCLNAQTLDTAKSKIFSAKDIELKIQNVNIETSFGNTIELKVFLKNKSSVLIWHSYDRLDLLGGFELEIVDAIGNILNKLVSQKENYGIMKRTFLQLQPKDKITATLSLSNFYKLEAGKYSIEPVCNSPNSTKNVKG